MSISDFDPEQQTQHVESRIIASLERIAQAFRVLLWQESKEFSLNPIQVQVLIFLRYHSEEKRKVSYLAEELNVTKATISDTIKALEQKRLIAKSYELNDTRSFLIHLTDEGRAVAEKTSLFTRQLQIPISRLHETDKENLLLSLINIIRSLNQAGIITVQRMCLTCSYYQFSEPGQHFCRLLNQNLRMADLRIDCPEHVMK